ncbi:hypothetical protein J2X11_000645 [Aeromicrobium panaciterrae]|uniref:Uncharacterized protein n=1 Tax=Aeromicrobium panaciterrae TaxID=363861 RepID=A0ABU1UKV3_9ACTN|nr:hypothetical protein [Aeromicrobium panaciterrae]MDR7085806.1 hypothetical protein [Aeromicrobium panaciterrae]
MKQQVAAAILAASMVGGVGTGVVAHQLNSDDPKASPTATPSTTATKPKPAKTKPAPVKTTAAPLPAALLPLTSLKILAGQVGPVKVGMTKAQAFATGYLNQDVPRTACGTVDKLAWKDAYKATLDIYTLDDGEVSSIGVSNPGPSTLSGLQVGSTFKAVKDVLGPEHAPEEMGYGQTGMIINQGDSWIGFLFNAAPDAVTDATPVSFIEVTRGNPPGLMRDGC